MRDPLADWRRVKTSSASRRRLARISGLALAGLAGAGFALAARGAPQAAQPAQVEASSQAAAAAARAVAAAEAARAQASRLARALTRALAGLGPDAAELAASAAPEEAAGAGAPVVELASLEAEIERLERELEASARAASEQLDRAQRDARIALETERARSQAELARHGLAPAERAADDPWTEIASLRIELDRERGERLAREREWLDYTRAFALLGAGAGGGLLEGLPGPHFSPQVPSLEQPAAARREEPPEDAGAVRARELQRALRTLLAVEEVRGIDLIEVGALGDGWIGPVLFRVVDLQGRLAGSLWAERLKLEGSRAGRSLTIVLESGYESHRGVRTPFDARPEFAELDSALEPGAEPAPGGVRRIVLPYVDPLAWIDRMPELFGATDLSAVLDDGLWDVERVRQALNRLCAEDAAFGYWRVRRVAGVAEGVLRDVHLEFLDRDGRLERRVFADRLSIRAAERGMLLSLEDGVQMRGDKKAPFLDGRYRIVLPRAELERWRAERLPGLVASEEPAAPGDAAAVEAAAEAESES